MLQTYHTSFAKKTPKTNRTRRLPNSIREYGRIAVRKLCKKVGHEGYSKRNFIYSNYMHQFADNPQCAYL